MEFPSCEWVVLVVIANPVKADPCSAVPSFLGKDKCQKLFGTGPYSGQGALGGAVSGGNSILDLLSNPLSLEGGIRHAFIRVSEVIIGGLLVIVGLNALIKAQTNVNVVGSTTKVAKSAVKAAVK